MNKVEKNDTNESTTAPASDFESQIKEGVIDPFPYDRLMVKYRKEKDYKNELRVVKRAIAVFNDHLRSVQQNILKGHRKRSTIAELSKSISVKTGLIDKKGQSQHIPEPVAGWMKRQATVQAKIVGQPRRKQKSKRTN